MNFKCLYSFTSSDIDLIEIKRSDLPAEATLSELYRWLVIDKQTAQIMPLTFKSMGKDGIDDLRIFQEGELRFNKFIADLNWNGKTYRLEWMKTEKVSEKILQQITVFLS